jgi:hypothetical protein
MMGRVSRCRPTERSPHRLKGISGEIYRSASLSTGLKYRVDSGGYTRYSVKVCKYRK